jgi:hypothetical protein
MSRDTGEREYRPGLWMIQFTALDSQRATEYARQGAAGDRPLEVLAAGRYGYAAVGTHRQVIALRDAVMAGGESFAITRAIMAELYPGGQLLSYQGSDPGPFRQEIRERLGLNLADDDRWELTRQFWCPARVLDVVLTDYSQLQLRQEDDH